MKFLIAVLVLFVSVNAFADEITWTNDGGNGWDDGDEVGQADMDEIKASVDDNDDRLDALLATDTCTTPPCSLTAGTTLGGVAIQTGTDDDVPESGDFGAAADLEADGSLSADVVAAAEMADADHGDISWSGGVASIDANAVALSTDTTGNYVATIADSGSSEVTVTGSGSEGAAVTLGIAASITRDSELSAYTVGTAAPVDGTDACTEGDMWLDHTANKVYWCVDSATDDWFGVALSDTP